MLIAMIAIPQILILTTYSYFLPRLRDTSNARVAFTLSLVLSFLALIAVVGWPDVTINGSKDAFIMGLAMFGLPALCLTAGSWLAAAIAGRFTNRESVLSVASFLTGATLFYLGGVAGVSIAIFVSGDF